MYRGQTLRQGLMLVFPSVSWCVMKLSRALNFIPRLIQFLPWYAGTDITRHVERTWWFQLPQALIMAIDFTTLSLSRSGALYLITTLGFVRCAPHSLLACYRWQIAKGRSSGFQQTWAERSSCIISLIDYPSRDLMHKSTPTFQSLYLCHSRDLLNLLSISDFLACCLSTVSIPSVSSISGTNIRYDIQALGGMFFYFGCFVHALN
jgi:hypothetical protein